MTPARRTEPIPPSLRKPPSVARESFQQTNTGSAQGKDTGTLFSGKRGRPKLHAGIGQLVENSALICNILRSSEKRDKIFAYLKRLKKKGVHPCNRPRIIAQSLHYPQVAVELVIQGKPEEIDEWFREFRSGMKRADEAAQRFWERKSA